MTERYDFYLRINIVTLTPVEEFCSCLVDNYFATQKEFLGILRPSYNAPLHPETNP